MQKLCLIAALAFLYFTNLGSVGFLGPDEPRYASIGREMARSGDWITPVLDGQPWFEKPPLLYWTTATGNWFGLTDEWAARLPIAIIGFAFLLFFYRTLEREFNRKVALTSTAILGTSAGWASLSFVAVTDLPMSAALNAALLIALFGPQALGARSTGGRESRYTAQGYLAGFLLGIAVLAKAFVPLILITPVFLIARGKRLQMIAACLLTAAPWHILCYLRNGDAYWDVYFWQHQVGRFLSSDLGHAQPFWYYLPVLLAGLFPWTPLVALLLRPRSLDDERVRFLLVFLVFGLVFFSASTNKLPAYVLPLLPAMAIVMGVALEKTKSSALWLVACSLLLCLIPMVAAILPDALISGLTHVSWTAGFSWMLLVPLIAAIASWSLARDDADQEWSDRRRWAALVVAIAAVISVAYLKSTAFPQLDQKVSVRAFARSHDLRTACASGLTRDQLYGLNYYANSPLPECTEGQRPRVTVTNTTLTIQ
ncbi:MAG: glycosyltransferase family 39 protein [Bryobacteraceae bacterium]